MYCGRLSEHNLTRIWVPSWEIVCEAEASVPLVHEALWD